MGFHARSLSRARALDARHSADRKLSGNFRLYAVRALVVCHRSSCAAILRRIIFHAAFLPLPANPRPKQKHIENAYHGCRSARHPRPKQRVINEMANSAQTFKHRYICCQSKIKRKRFATFTRLRACFIGGRECARCVRHGCSVDVCTKIARVI